jgi:hypothetical protein
MTFAAGALGASAGMADGALQQGTTQRRRGVGRGASGGSGWRVSVPSIQMTNTRAGPINTFLHFLFGTAAGLLGTKDAGGDCPNCSTVQRLSATLASTKRPMSSFVCRKVIRIDNPDYEEEI